MRMGWRRELKEAMTSLDHRPGEGQRPQSGPLRVRESRPPRAQLCRRGAVVGTPAADVGARSGSGRSAWSQTELGSRLRHFPEP